MSDLSEFIADFLKILADPIKIDIIKLLKDNKKNSKQIQQNLMVSQANVSQKINELKKLEIIQAEKIKNIFYYSIVDSDIYKILSILTSYILDLQKKKIDKLKNIDNVEKLI